jgi:hypothetical protein
MPSPGSGKQQPTSPDLALPPAWVSNLPHRSKLSAKVCIHTTHAAVYLPFRLFTVTHMPTSAPTPTPTVCPTRTPSDTPTPAPTPVIVPWTVPPTQFPTAKATQAPTSTPTKQPTSQPTVSPTYAPTYKLASCRTISIKDPRSGSGIAYFTEYTVQTGQMYHNRPVYTHDSGGSKLQLYHTHGMWVVGHEIGGVGFSLGVTSQASRPDLAGHDAHWAYFLNGVPHSLEGATAICTGNRPLPQIASDGAKRLQLLGTVKVPRTDNGHSTGWA